MDLEFKKKIFLQNREDDITMKLIKLIYYKFYLFTGIRIGDSVIGDSVM
jgi:hypothetical protein